MINILEYMTICELVLLRNQIRGAIEFEDKRPERERLVTIQMAIIDEIRSRFELPDEVEV